ncbi:ATP-dependent DNA helicase RecG, partial [Clostridioides difficile]|nr:ATP-dependent DNA helicase RecG [Clostridioides difficile]
PRDSILVLWKGKKKINNLELTSCELEYLTNSPKNTCRFMPVYQLTYGVTNKEIMSIIRTVLEDKELIIQEYMPQRIIEKYRLCSIDFAVRNIHSPSSKESLKIALYRIVFEELLILQLGLFVFKSGRNKEDGIKFETSKDLKKIISALPFKLTKAQNRALDEIIQDMNLEKIMNRLVQGDVGSGKTVVALLALANCVLNGYQGALMAPTEILAGQHYISLTESLKDFGINVGLLIGSLTKKQKDTVLEQIKNNEIDILIGTHALIEDKVEFNNIGLVITDEQHRFGVMQRSKLSLKGANPDILVMTATPIPRTLALILYGDLDISIIDELPPGRQPIETIAIEKSKRDRAYNNLVRREVESGRQVYIVCPLVEESEAIEAKSAVELVEELRAEYFHDLRLGLLHGKMKSSEKDEVMRLFKNKEIDILVSTTVIEVGVNVPNATLMIIENAERFGLAQLHQLRGRVGRGSHKSYCVLIYDSKTDVCRQRMAIMEETNDGFKISEKDLEIRGPGEFFGTRQHGLPELKVANLFKHIKILKLAQQEARYILGEDNNLQLKENMALKKEIIDKFKDTLKEISLN